MALEESVGKQVETSMKHADKQLSKISKRLEDEYSYLYPSSSTHTDPYATSMRLRILQHQLDELCEQSLEAHKQRMEIMNLCETDISKSFIFAKQIQSHLSSSNITSDSLVEPLNNRLVQLDQQLSNMSERFPKGNTIFLRTLLSRLGLSASDVDLALHSSPLSTTTTGNAGDGEKCNSDQPLGTRGIHGTGRNNTRSSSSTTTKRTSAPNGPPKTRSEAVSKGSTPTLSSKSGSNDKSKTLRFEPIGKPTFNRLPRNLKVKAGKLPQVNEFYEEVFNQLVQHSEGMSSKKLMESMGEESMQRFEILRGLAVLRCADGVWMLSCQKV